MRRITYKAAINEALHEEMTKDNGVILLGEDIGPGGVGGVTKGLRDRFGEERVIDMPIAETAIIGSAVGASLAGLRPVAEIMHVDFIFICMDGICNWAAKQRFLSGGKVGVPITIRAPSGARGFGPHHGQCLEACFQNIPGLKLVMPSTPYDAKGLLKSAIRDNDPVIFFENKYSYGIEDDVPEEEYTIPLGQADIKREGSDVTVVAISRMVYEAMTAADKLATDGISIEVIDPRTITPLDKETILNSVKKTGRLVIAHEAVKTGGFGSEIAAIIAEEGFDYLDAPVKRIGAAFAPIPFSKPLEEFCLPTGEDIIRAVKEIMG